MTLRKTITVILTFCLSFDNITFLRRIIAQSIHLRHHIVYRVYHCDVLLHWPKMVNGENDIMLVLFPIYDGLKSKKK